MCHDINPLGTTMHLRELDRFAARTRNARRSSSPAYGHLLIALLRRIRERARRRFRVPGLARLALLRTGTSPLGDRSA